MLDEKIIGLKKKIAETREQMNTQIEEAKAKAEGGDVAAAKEIKSKIDELKLQITTLEDELTTLEDVKSLEPEDLSKDKEGETRSRGGKTIISPEQKEVEGFEKFIRTKGAETRDLNTTTGGVFVPKDVVNAVFELKESDVELSSLATVQPVSTKSGSFPVARRHAGVLKTKAELAAMEDVSEELFIDVEYNIETRAGKIALSNELIEDSAVNVVEHVKKQLRRLIKNTNNVNVIEKLKTFTKVTASTVDDLKKVHNVDLDPALEQVVITNQSGFNYLDTLKDADGNYLLQPNLSTPTGKGLFGAPIHVISDKLLPNVGTKGVPPYPIFMGDIEEAVAIFNRKQIEVQWEKFDSYSQGLAIVLRNDYQKVDAEAARYIELTPPVVPAG